MKVLLVANYGPDRQNSMARYADLLASGLQKRGYAVEIIRPQAIATRLVRRESAFFRWLGYIDKFVLFPPLLRLRARRFDLVHVCDHSNSCYLRWTGKTPALITVHDVLAIRSALGHFPEFPTRWSGEKLQRWILRGLAGAKRIVCVSQKTREDLQSLLPIPPPMDLIPNPHSGNFQPASAESILAVRRACGLAAEDEYLLNVGSEVWYKNRPGVLRMLAELRKFPRFERMKLVMAGAPLPAPLRASARGLGGIAECPELSDKQLAALYTGALALLFPSLEEGFGWPIIEAQACGCPVITSARPPMTEIAGGAAILVDPEDAPAAAAEIAAGIENAPSLIREGLVNVRAYTMDIAMDGYCRVYREMTSGSLHKQRETTV